MYLKLFRTSKVKFTIVLGNNCTDVTKSSVDLRKFRLFMISFYAVKHNDYAYKKLIS